MFDLDLPDVLTRGFLFVLFICIIVYLIRLISSVIHQWRMGAVYELEQKEKEIQKRNSSLSDDELIKQANEGLGLKPDNKSKKGSNGSV